MPRDCGQDQTRRRLLLNAPSLPREHRRIKRAMTAPIMTSIVNWLPLFTLLATNGVSTVGNALTIIALTWFVLSGLTEGLESV